MRLNHYFIILIGMLCIVKAFANPLPVPSPDVHSAFLLEPWKPNAPSVIVFKDPFCPYCVKALEKKDELKDFNVFMFWYPIFGDRSDQRVSQIFQCASPTGHLVIASVIAKTSPDCHGDINLHLMELNRKMYEAYSPSGVPSYYLGGAQTSVLALKELKRSMPSVQPSVNLELSRYDKNRLNIQSQNAGNILLLLPANYEKTPEIISVAKNHTEYNWYVFADGSGGSYVRICMEMIGNCDSKMLLTYSSLSKEIMLLFGVDALVSPMLIMNGKLLSYSEIKKLPFFDKQYFSM